MKVQVIKNRIKKVLAYSLTISVFTIISLFLILQMPPVQNWFASRFLKDFSQITGFPASVESFRMIWFDRLEVSGITIQDPAQNTMIGVERLIVNFRLASLLTKGDLYIDGIVADNAQVYITKPNCDSTSLLNINEWINRINEAYPAKSDTTSVRSTRIQIGEALLTNSVFTYNDCSPDSLKNQFDYHHFTIDLDEGQLKSFLLQGDTTEFMVRTLIAEDRATKLKIHQLSTIFHISQKEMYFHNLNASVGNSIIQDTLEFYYQKQSDMADFNHKVKVRARIDSTTLDPRDLVHFAPQLKIFKRPVTFAGEFNGKVSNFRITNLMLKSGQTALYGECDMEGLPDINETFIILNLRNSILSPGDLDFVLTDQMLASIKPLGNVSMDGQFLGYPNDFVANGTFKSNIGTIQSDLNFKVNPDDPGLSNYKGKLTLTEFNLGFYLNDTVTYQRLNLSGNIEGKGLTQSNADFKLNGTIDKLGVLGYDYKNITTNAQFAFGYIDGLVKINDPNLEFTAKGSLDLRENRNRVRINGILDTANVHNLGFVSTPLLVKSDFNVDFTGLDLDKINGYIDLHETFITYGPQSLHATDFDVRAINNSSERKIEINSEFFNASIGGQFKFSELVRDFNTLTKELFLNLKNDAAEIKSYYLTKKPNSSTYQTTIKGELISIKPIANLLGIDFDLTPNTKLEGRFTRGYTTIFNAYTEIDSIWYNGQYYLNTVAEITASKIADSTKILAMATITSEHQHLMPGFSTEGFITEAIWDQNHVSFSTEARQVKSTNAARIKGTIDFLADSSVLRFEPSTIRLLDRSWNFIPDNYIALTKKTWTFHDVKLQNEEQIISVQGKISPDPDKILTFLVSKLDLSIFDAFSVQKIKGQLDGQVDISNVYKSSSIQNNINIHDLTINDFLVGNIVGKNTWDTLEQKFDVKVYIDRAEQNILNIVGSYTPRYKFNQLDLIATFTDADLKIAEPFMKGIFSQIRGKFNGDFAIQGNLTSPEMTGEGELTEGHILIDYLKTAYRMTGRIGMTQGSIYLQDIELSDGLRNKGRLDGAISHNGFRNMTLELNGAFRNLQVMNTSVKDNSLFYGQAFSTGSIRIYGPFNNLGFDITARSEKNTRIYIPISLTSAPERKDFISFVNFKNQGPAKTNSTSTKVNLTGINMNLNLQITTDAYCEIIFDVKAGDIIRGRGTGDLKLQLDTKGDFTMFGPFEFTQGWYNFTLYELINKEFEIQKGSRITWYGDPYAATLDINATYNQLASFTPILNETDPAVLNAAGLKRKYPAQVVLMLDGPMLAPEINFDIISKDLPKNIQTESRVVNLELAFVAFKNKLDEQELKRQVFSLIVLRKFSPPESFNTSGSVMGSVSELLSNQLSYWMSQVDQNLEIDVDLGSMDQEAFNTFQLRFSYTFLNGRLRVTGDGTFNNAGNNSGNPQTPPSTVAGDWTVDYMLTADGKLRMKMYSRTNYNPILASINNQTAITTGASIIHTQSFEKLRDLFQRSRRTELINKEKYQSQPDSAIE